MEQHGSKGNITSMKGPCHEQPWCVRTFSDSHRHSHFRRSSTYPVLEDIRQSGVFSLAQSLDVLAPCQHWASVFSGILRLAEPQEDSELIDAVDFVQETSAGSPDLKGKRGFFNLLRHITHDNCQIPMCPASL